MRIRYAFLAATLVAAFAWGGAARSADDPAAERPAAERPAAGRAAANLTEPTDRRSEVVAPTDRQALAEAAKAAERDGRFRRLDGYLRFMAERLDFYFTIEESAPSYFPPNVAERRGCPRVFDVGSIDEFVSAMNERLEGVRVVRSETFPNVVHFASKNLPEENYVLDRWVSTRYAGSLALLPSRLGKEAGGGLMGWSVGVPPDLVYGDQETRVDVSAVDRPIRDILTAAVPGISVSAIEGLEAKELPPKDEYGEERETPPGEYDRLLWISQTRAQDSPLVQVRYSGHVFDAEVRRFLAGGKGWDFGDYLHVMARRLGFHYTIEDARAPGDDDAPPIDRIETFDRRSDFDSIDEFAAHVDANVEGIRVVRSEKVPSVIHVIADRLLTDDYAMERRVTIRDFEGSLAEVVLRIGSETQGAIGLVMGGGIPNTEPADWSSQTTLDVENATVRDALTIAAPLDRRFLWKLDRTFQTDDDREAKRVFVKYLWAGWTDEEHILHEHGLTGYLKEMGCRLDCYFAYEDQGGGYRNWRREFQEDFVLYDLDFDVRTIDALVASLDDVLNRRYVYDERRDRNVPRRIERVRVVRSEKYPRVIRLIDASPSREELPVLDRRIDFGFHGKLDEVPKALKAIDARIDRAGTYPPGSTRDVPHDDEWGDEFPNVKVGLENLTVRDALVGASPFDGHRRVILRTTSMSRFQEPKTLVRYFGALDEVAEALGYDENPAPKPPVLPPDAQGVPAADPFQ